MHAFVRILPIIALVVAAPGARADATAMAPGIVVDVDARRAVFADADGFATALALADGVPAWRSREPAFPLLETRGRVVALGVVEARGAGQLLLLDAATGVVSERVVFDVPAHVAATVVPSPASVFVVVAEPSPRGARVHWRETAQPLRGAVLEDGSDEPRTTTGAFEVVFDAAGARTVAIDAAIAMPLLPPPDLAADERLPGLGERQFRGHGDFSAMSATPVPDDRFGAVWRWTVRERGARGRSFAGPSLPFAYLPFALLGDTLVYRSDAVSWREADGRTVGHGPRLVGFDLANGRERWYFDVYEPVHRGSLPP